MLMLRAKSAYAEHALPPAEAHGDRSVAVRNITLYSGQTSALSLDGGTLNAFAPMSFAANEQNTNLGQVSNAVKRPGEDFVRPRNVQRQL